MPFPIKSCVVCNEEFELRPGKPGSPTAASPASRPEQEESTAKEKLYADERNSLAEANEARRAAMKNLLYRKDS